MADSPENSAHSVKIWLQSEGGNSDQLHRQVHLFDTTGLEFLQQLPRSILVIEDDLFLATHMINIVQSLGHNAFGPARTLADALAFCKECAPDLIVSDIQLADGSSGIEAVNSLLEMYSVPVLFVSGNLDILNSANRPIPSITIPKPFRWEDFEAGIKQAIAFELDARPAVT